MSFRLTPIFIRGIEQPATSVLLETAGLPQLQKGNAVDFYDTNKQYDRLFIGEKNKVTVVSNGRLAYAAFDDETLFHELAPAEITVLIWDETSGVFGFCCIKDGQTLRKVMVVDGSVECDEGNPVAEELAIDAETLFEPDEKEEMLEAEGEEGYAEIVKGETITRAANQLAKRYLGAALMQLSERVELFEYH